MVGLPTQQTSLYGRKPFVRTQIRHGMSRRQLVVPGAYALFETDKSCPRVGDKL